jgi:hypothetical protein
VSFPALDVDTYEVELCFGIFNGDRICTEPFNLTVTTGWDLCRTFNEGVEIPDVQIDRYIASVPG